VKITATMPSIIRRTLSDFAILLGRTNPRDTAV
jgi:hypothetical protein